MNIEKAAQKLADCMDYPWEFMPEQGRENMRNHVKAIFEAANSAPPEDVRAVVDEPVAWANGQQLLLCSKSKLDVDHPNPLYHQLPRQIAGSALSTEYCDTPLYRQPQCSEVSQQCLEHLRTQGTLLPHHTLLPHPPRHEGFLQPEREVPGYTLEQMKEYGALCAAEALRQNK